MQDAAGNITIKAIGEAPSEFPWLLVAVAASVATVGGYLVLAPSKEKKQPKKKRKG